MADWKNPYESGEPSEPPPQQYSDGAAPMPRDTSWIKQVTVVAILLLVQGGLELVAGIFYAAMGPFMVSIMKMAEAESGGDMDVRVQAQPPEEMFWFIGGIYMAIGSVAIICGILKIIAGIRNLKYKSRVLGFVALASGLVTAMTCYCAPTAIGLAIYGMIVYVNSDVARAFDLSKQGYTAEQIKAGA